MKIKVTSGPYLGEEMEVVYRKNYQLRYMCTGRNVFKTQHDAVIIELPESFCVKKPKNDERSQNWKKYINWLNNKSYNVFRVAGDIWNYYGVTKGIYRSGDDPFGTEILLTDIIKYINYESDSKNRPTLHNLKTKKGRLAYAREKYPVGTKFKIAYAGKRYSESEYEKIREVEFEPQEENKGNIEATVFGYVYVHETGSWAEIVTDEKERDQDFIQQEEKVQLIQRLKRSALKEIHYVACDSWKNKLEEYSKRNTLEDFIELSDYEVEEMFEACTEPQLLIVSKYLTRSKGVDLSQFAIKSGSILQVRNGGKYKDRAFYLSSDYDWEIKEDDSEDLCLIPTRK